MLQLYIKYQSEVTWWVIGWLACATLDCLINGNYVFAAIDAGLAYFNFYMWKNR